jgi:hypothetical protein
MKTHIAILGFTIVAALIGGGGCSRSDTVVEGIVYSVEYQKVDGSKISLSRATRIRSNPNFPGKPTELYGRLTPDFLILRRPTVKDSTAEVIPVSRLISLQFGDGGIRYDAESRSGMEGAPAGPAKPAAETPVASPPSTP